MTVECSASILRSNLDSLGNGPDVNSSRHECHLCYLREPLPSRILVKSGRETRMSARSQRNVNHWDRDCMQLRLRVAPRKSRKNMTCARSSSIKCVCFMFTYFQCQYLHITSSHICEISFTKPTPASMHERWSLQNKCHSVNRTSPFDQMLCLAGHQLTCMHDTLWIFIDLSCWKSSWEAMVGDQFDFGCTLF